MTNLATGKLPYSKNLKTIKCIPNSKCNDKVYTLRPVDEHTTPIAKLNVQSYLLDESSSSYDFSSSSSGFSSYDKNLLKRSSKEVGKEAIALKSNSMPLGYICLENEDCTISKHPYYRDSDCGFNWKISLKIHEASIDDDHKTPSDIRVSSAKDVYKDLRSVIKLLNKQGVAKFSKDISCYCKFRTKK